MNKKVGNIHFYICFFMFSCLEARVISLFELPEKDAALLLPIERAVEKEMHKKRFVFRPTKQKKHITLAVLTKFHETLRDLQKNHPQVVPSIATWAGNRTPFSITPMLGSARVELWVPPYFKNQQFQKYPDYYNIVITFAPYAPLEGFTQGLDTQLRKIHSYRYNRREQFVPHATLGKVYPHANEFTDREVAMLHDVIRVVNSQRPLGVGNPRALNQLSCLLVKESNTQQMCLPLGKKQRNQPKKK